MQLVFKLLVLKYVSSDQDVPASDTVSEISSKNTHFYQKSPSFLLNLNSTTFEAVSYQESKSAKICKNSIFEKKIRHEKFNIFFNFFLKKSYESVDSISGI